MVLSYLVLTIVGVRPEPRLEKAKAIDSHHVPSAPHPAPLGKSGGSFSLRKPIPVILEPFGKGSVNGIVIFGLDKCRCQT